jgi:hypothetical protein
MVTKAGLTVRKVIVPCEFFDIGDILRNNKTKPAKRIKKETEDKYEVIRTSTIAKYQSINQSTISSEANRTDDSNNIDTKDVSNNRLFYKPTGQ